MRISHLLFLVAMFNCQFLVAQNKEAENKSISNLLDSLNEYAAKAKFEKYFSLYDADAIFMGTDATERWSKNEFAEWAKPIFNKGKAWNFKSVERHIYFDASGNYAWFDELLSTQMKICRGSGVLVKVGKEWKLKQYVLSMTIPNSVSKDVVGIKSVLEDEIINKMK